MVKQYIVQSNNIEERRNFYNYLVNNGYKPIENFKQQNFINNKFLLFFFFSYAFN